MGLNHLTLHEIIKFNNIKTNETVVNPININGHTDEERVKISNLNATVPVAINFIENKIKKFEKYKLIFHKKTHRIRPIRFREEITNDYLDIYEFYAYKSGKTFITIFDFSKKISHSATNKLNSKSSKLNLNNYELDLLNFIENANRLGMKIEVVSTWFNNLKLPNLNAVKLEGEEVNLGPEWGKYKTTGTSKITSLGLCINELPFKNLKISLSHDGSIYIYPGFLEEKELLKLAELIIQIKEFEG